MRILVYCQHVLGMGHLFRCLELVRALHRHEVLLVTGGPEVPVDLSGAEHVRHERLPGLEMDPHFSALRPTTQGADLDTVQAERKARLLDLLAAFRPQVLLVELFPFGRRAFGFELLPLLAEAARQGCRRVCSLRDILVEKKDQAGFESRVLARLNPHFDLLLVHADPTVCTLEQTFSRVADIRPAIAYTGYVARAPEPGAGAALRAEQGLGPEDLQLVAAIGSGSVGGELLEASLEASALLARTRPHRLRIFGGPLLDEARFAALCARARSLPHVVVERFSPRYPAWLAAADLSLSLGGYNTVLSLAAAGTPGLVLPFAQNREQRMRALQLQARGYLRLLTPEDLDPERLAALVTRELGVARESAGARPRLELQGARNTARCLEGLQAPPQVRGSVRHGVAQPWTTGGNESAWEAFFAGLGDLVRAQGGGRVFFRADDVAVPGAACTRMLELFLRHETPLWAAVVPAWLQAERWAALRAASRDASLICWHQHGWRHANHEVWGKKSEFGPGRALELVRADLLKGRDKLAQLLGRRFTPLFTPPWNRLRPDALPLLVELGYAGLSCDAKTARVLRPSGADAREALCAFPLRPVHADLHTRRETAPQAALDGLLQDFATGLATGCCGVMLHHQRMNQAAFAFLERLLRALPSLGLEPVLPE